MMAVFGDKRAWSINQKKSHSLYQVVSPDSFVEFQAQNSFRIAVNQTLATVGFQEERDPWEPYIE